MKGKYAEEQALRQQIITLIQQLPDEALEQLLEQLDAELKNLLQEGKLGLPGEPPVQHSDFEDGE